MNAPDGSIFVLGMPLICIFALGAVSYIFRNRTKLKNIFYTLCIIVLILYYCFALNPNEGVALAAVLSALTFYGILIFWSHKHR